MIFCALQKLHGQPKRNGSSWTPCTEFARRVSSARTATPPTQVDEQGNISSASSSQLLRLSLALSPQGKLATDTAQSPCICSKGDASASWAQWGYRSVTRCQQKGKSLKSGTSIAILGRTASSSKQSISARYAMTSR